MVDKKDLDNIDLFESLSDTEKNNLSKCMEKKIFYKGDSIFSEDTHGGVLFLIKSGEVKISKVIREGERQTLNVLGSGDHFGSISLLDGLERSASADVISDCTVLELRKKDFDAFIQRFPEAALKVLRQIIISLCSFLRTMDDKFVDMVKYITLDR